MNKKKLALSSSNNRYWRN